MLCSLNLPAFGSAPAAGSSGPADSSSDEIGDNEDERDDERNEKAQRDGDTRERDERRSLDFARLSSSLNRWASSRGWVARRFASSPSSVCRWTSGSPPRGAPSTGSSRRPLISHVAPFVLVGHAPSFPDSRCDRLAIDSASEAGGWPAAAARRPRAWRTSGYLGRLLGRKRRP